MQHICRVLRGNWCRLQIKRYFVILSIHSTGTSCFAEAQHFLRQTTKTISGETYTAWVGACASGAGSSIMQIRPRQIGSLSSVKKAGCFQKAPLSLFPGKSVILETKTPPWLHNSLSQPTTLFPLTQIPSREPGERVHSFAAVIDYIIIPSERAQRATEPSYQPSIGAFHALGGVSKSVRSGKGRRLRCQTSCSFGTLKALCEKIHISSLNNSETFKEDGVVSYCFG